MVWVRIKERDSRLEHVGEKVDDPRAPHHVFGKLDVEVPVVGVTACSGR